MILSDLLAEVIKIEPPVEEICEMDDPVAGEMYLPGVAVKMSKTPGRIGPVPTPGQHIYEIISSVLGYDSARSVTCEAPARSRRLARAVPLTPVV